MVAMVVQADRNKENAGHRLNLLGGVVVLLGQEFLCLLHVEGVHELISLFRPLTSEGSAAVEA